jgi:benzoylformate decarboxylase
MTGAQAFYEMLVREGVDYIFGNPGTSELPLMDVFAERSEIEYILALHEDSALGVAAGYAEASGKPAVVNLHTNPGLAHALGNLYNAYRAGTPMIVTAGQQDTRSLIGEPLLQADMVALARQHTKWAWEVKAAAEIPFALARAFTLATTAPTGPVFLSLPVNVMEEVDDMEFPQVTRIGQRVRGDRSQIEAAAQLLAEAQQPVIIAGDGCARSGGLPELVRLAEAIGARVYPEVLHSLLDFPTDHPLFAGPLSPAAQAAHAQLSGADVILTVGVYTLAPLVYTGTKIIPADAKLIQIDANERELGKNYPAHLAILADPRTAVLEIIEVLESIIDVEVRETIQQRSKIVGDRIAESRAKFAEQVLGSGADEVISPAQLAREMRLLAADDAIIVDEAVTATAYVRTLFPLREPDSYFFAKGGSLGYGLPLAVGVKMARRDRQVICTIGDGSLLYSPQALWTAARFNLGVVFVVFNNTSYLILKGGLLAMKGKSVERNIYTGMDITEPAIDFVKMAESMGVAAKRVEEGKDLRPALEWAFKESQNHNQPHLLDVLVSSELRSMLR